MTTTSVTNLFGRKIFSGIQPTGVPHLGNYFGAIEQWLKLTKRHHEDHPIGGQKPIFCIVDVHAYSSQRTQFGEQLYANILSSLASLLALGFDPNKCILFRQSDVLEHNYLSNVFHNVVSIERLSGMIQFKDKVAARKLQQHSESAKVHSIPTGLLTYPCLQAADILLYQADLVPVGEDQSQHIELTRHIANKFNKIVNKRFFPLPIGLMEQSEHARRIKSLRDPTKKMSKSDPDWRSTISIMDEPDVIMVKCKKALTDCDSRVLYRPDDRPGVANLMRLLLLTSQSGGGGFRGQWSIEEMEKHFESKQTADLKIKLAESLIERFKPARDHYKRLVADRANLEQILKIGAEEARQLAAITVSRVRHELGSHRLL